MSAPEIIYPPAVGGGTPVGGFGNPNTIPRWTGATTLGDSLLSQSGAIVTNSGTFRAANGVPTEPAYTFSGSSGTGMYRATSGALLRFAVSGAYAFGVDTNGFVGIGTTSPSAKLDIRGSARLEVADPRFDLVGTYRSFMTQVVDGANAAASYWRLYDLTASANRIVCDASGNVGIGTAAPWSKISAVTANGADTISVGFSFDSSNNYRSGISTNWSSVAAAQNLVGFLVSNATTTGFTRVMTLNGGGQAAIGTSSFTSGCSLTVAQSIDASQSAQGLKLPATPGNGDAQTLDAYQEMGSGAYAAVTATLTCGTSGTITLKTTSDQDKLYVTRIGRTVHVSGYLVVDSVASPTGRLTITTSTALPAVKNGASANIVFTGPTGLVAGDIIQPTISASTIFCDVYNGGVQSQTGAAKMQANTSLWVSFSYHAA